MGQLSFAPSDIVYLDTAPIIYSVEKHADYLPLMKPLWLASQNGDVEVITSELTLLETLVAPIKQNDSLLYDAYENLLTKTEVRALPITAEVLHSAAELRAQYYLKTPDAIYAATALLNGCDLFVSNDPIFNRISGLRVEILKDLI